VCPLTPKNSAGQHRSKSMEKGYGWRDGPAVRDGALVLGEDMVLAESDFCSEPLVCLDRKINRKGKRWLD